MRKLLRPRISRNNVSIDSIAVENAVVTEIQTGSTSNENVLLFAKPKLFAKLNNVCVFNRVNRASISGELGVGSGI